MKKICKIVLFNTLIIILFLFVLEFLTFLTVFVHDENYNHRNLKDYPSDFQNIFESQYNKHFLEHLYFDFESFRKPTIQNEIGEKNSVVLVGCSFTYGENLQDNETFSHLLSQYTGRNVYNLGLIGGSLREMLYILRNDNLLYELVPKNEKVDYVIYTYIYDHIYRLNFNMRAHSPVFKEKNNTLEYSDYSILRQSSCLINKIRENLVFKNNNVQQKMTALEYLYIRELNKEVKKKFNNAQLVILSYWNTPDLKIDLEKLKQEGIIVIDIEKYFDDLHSDKYSFPDTHPKTEAWEEIVPIIAPYLEEQVL